MRDSDIGLLLAILLALTIAGSSWALAPVHPYAYAWNPDNLIRLHVVSNSDSGADQSLKLQVRDAVLTGLRPQLYELDATVARQWLAGAVDRIQELAGTVPGIQEQGQAVEVVVGTFRFPHRAYQGVVLPAGEYYALQVILGAGQGSNWWCVLFPPLCLVDIATGTEETAMGKPETERLRAITEHELNRAPLRVRLAALELMTRRGWLPRRPPWHWVARPQAGRPDPQP
jgi:stage II sporulation protein R